MDFERQERELRLKDMVFGVLRRWRSILVLALVCALVLGGWRFYRLQRHNVALQDRTAYLTAKEEYDHWFAAKQHEVRWLKDRIGQQQEYMEQSVMMGLDSTNVGRAELGLYVTAGDADLSRTILECYREAITDSAFIDSAARELGIESRYFRELLTITRQQSIEDVSVRQDNCISVVIYHENLERVRTMLELVQTQLTAAEETVQAKMGDHTLQQVLTGPGMMVDNVELAGRQWAEKQRLSAYETALTNLEKSSTSWVAPLDPAGSMANPLRGTVKWAILGCLLGGALGCGLAVLAVLFGDKLYSATDLQGRYRLRILGCVAGSGKRCLIDRWLDRLEGRTIQDTPQNHRRLALLVKKLAGTDRILLWGCEDLTQSLNSRLGLSMTVTQHPLDTPEALEQLENCDGVIIVAVCGVDRYSEIRKTMELAADLGKKNLGCIVAEY